MRKMDIANYVIYDLANRFVGDDATDLNSEIVNLVADTWCKKHFVSVKHDLYHHHDEKLNHKFII